MTEWVTDDDVAEDGEFFDEFPTEEFSQVQSPLDQAATLSTTPEDRPPGTPFDGYLDDEIAAELAGDPAPVWFGMRWRDIPTEHQTEAWNGLRRWVDWLIKEYRLTTSDVPPCWYRHTNIVAELYAGMCMEYKVWQEDEPGLGPTMFWHTNLQQIIMRLKMMVDDAGCTREGSHKEPVAYGDTPAHELAYNEDDWQQHVGTVKEQITIERPAHNVMYVRARIESDDNEPVAVSDPVGIKRLSSPGQPELSVEHVSLHGRETVLEVRWEHHDEHDHLLWETSVDGKTWDPYSD